MDEVYYDSAYLFKMQALEQGSDPVRAHAATVAGLACSLHGRAEFACICHRKFREGAANQNDVRSLLAQLHADTVAGGIRWLPITRAMIERVEEMCQAASRQSFSSRNIPC